MDLSAFADVVPYLTHPLALTGFLLLLFFSIHRTLIGSGILPPVDQSAAPGIVRLVLHYGFVIALVVVLAGFGLRAYEASVVADAARGPDEIRQTTKGGPAVAGTKGDVTIIIDGQRPADEAEAGR